MNKLKEFKEYLNKINQYEQASNILQWDMQTCMPYNGGDSIVVELKKVRK